MTHRHRKHRMHQSSREARASLNINERQQAVLAVFAEKFHPLTDKECAGFLGWDATSSRPRISDLVTKGMLMERGRVEEEGSRVRVRVCSITSRGMGALEKMRQGVVK